MLYEFLIFNRAELIVRCRAKVALRTSPKADATELVHGIPLFLDQLIKTLQLEQGSNHIQSRQVSGPSDGTSASSEIGVSAALHGRELLDQGFTVEQVVHDYGDLCQAITDLAFEQNVEIQVDEFRTFNRCLDNAIADAVSEFSLQRDAVAGYGEAHELNERVGFLVHELRNLVNTARLAFTAIKRGNVGFAGATGAVLERSLTRLRNLVDHSIADVRATAGLPPRRELILVSDLIGEVEASALLEAQAQDCAFLVSAIDPSLTIFADKEMLLSAIGNLLQNAFKFTKRGTKVTLDAHASADRVVIAVTDDGDGLRPGDESKVFQPFVQTGSDRSGLGLGLAICRRNVEANDGVLIVRGMTGSGSVFSVELPRHSIPSHAL